MKKERPFYDWDDFRGQRRGQQKRDVTRKKARLRKRRMRDQNNTSFM